MNDSVKTIPELYYDLLALAIPGILTLGLIMLSPAAAGLVKHLTNLTVVDRALLTIFGGYVLGHVLASVSDVLLRKPTWFLFGEPSRTLLGLHDSRAPLVKAVPKAFNAGMASAIRREIQALLPSADDQLEAHSLLDICEQHIKRVDREAGLLCQKRHATVVLCRNMAVGVAACLPCYWSVGVAARWLIVFMVLALGHRWNYLRVRRAQFLYHTFHVVVQGSESVRMASV